MCVIGSRGVQRRSRKRNSSEQPRDRDASPRVELVSARAHKHAFNISRLIARSANAFDSAHANQGRFNCVIAIT